MITELKRRILAIRERTFRKIRSAHPAISIRQARFHARVWTEMEIKRKKESLHEQALEALREKHLDESPGL